MTHRICLAVPCYNEAARLDRGAFTRLLASQPDVTVVFVDDGSRDATPKILSELAAAHPGRLSVLSLPQNLGKAEAVRRGMLAALDTGASYAGFWDGDLATPLEELPHLVAELDARPEVDVVMGSRVKLMGRDIRRSAGRHYAGRVFATAAAVTLGIPVYDTQCGAKVFRSCRAVREAFKDPFGSPWNFDVEMLARYLRAADGKGGAGIYEVPLRVWREVPGSKMGLAAALHAAWDLLRIARR